MAQCRGCKTHIPDINVEFGGNHYWTVDGDLYCSEQCHDDSMNQIIKAISTDEGFRRYMGLSPKGERQ